MRACILRYGLPCWVLLLLLLLVACSSNGANTTGSQGAAKTTRSAAAMMPSPAATTAQGMGGPGCKPPSIITKSATGLPETQGTGRGMEIWALLFGGMQVGQDQKIVWRLTGDGDPQFITTGPHGERARVVFGPTAHDGSNWHHDGDEWGIGFNFQATGCWDLHVSRGKAVGDVWLMVK